MSAERYYLESAMQEAEYAYQAGTYPIGAIIVAPNGEIIGRGYNHVYSRGDFTSHAEMEAIRDAGPLLMREPNFEACRLYTTMEPCLMCCGAILLARITQVIWIIDDNLYGSLRCLCTSPHSLDASWQRETPEIGIAENYITSRRTCDEAVVNSAPYHGGCITSSLCKEGVPTIPKLPIGYAGKINSLSFFPAGEDDLAMRLSTWMEKWNDKKEATLRRWRDGEMEFCDGSYAELMERKI